ncbi:MAG: helix-turn-helix transcriptional regulator [Lachnospiraceae bacterium]|nr:helix-turn-helix transcriptional regulator [Lachnospiraceae bacterium]
MTISERLFNIMKEKDISMPELSRMTGISRHTIFDWQRRNTNPGAEKIMVICEALQITPEELLIGIPEKSEIDDDISVSVKDIEIEIIKDYNELSDKKRKDYWHI